MKFRLAAVTLALTLLCGCSETGSPHTDESVQETSADITETTSATKTTETQTSSASARPDMPRHLSQEQSVLDNAEDKYYLLTDSRYPVYADTEISYYPTGEDFYEALLDELSQAQEFIFLEYYIVSEGEMLDGLIDVLKDRLDAGVEVKFMCDGFFQNDAFAEKLNSYGINCMLYREPDRVSINMRDHRKLAVIDGKTAFMGGVNIGDEYINVDSPYGRWKDAAIKIHGSAVRSCTELFFEQWAFGSELESCTDYLDRSQPAKAEGYVLPYGESPLDECNAAREIYLEIMGSAKEYLYMTAPYLNIDDEVENAICAAAERGVDVVLIVPGIPDKPYMELIARTHYRTLVNAGVRLYRFDPGFIHSKVFVSDGHIATVGSVNLNNRSFYCDFECGAVLMDVPCIEDIKADILTTLGECTQLTDENIIDLTPEEKARLSLYMTLGELM